MKVQVLGQLLIAVSFVSFTPTGGMAGPHTPAAPPAAPQAARKYLLSVGIANYAGKPLRGCVNDAVAMKEMLVNQFGFDPSGTTLLSDKEATRGNILWGIQNYADKVGNGDLFVFYFSGHGTIFPDYQSRLQDETADLDLSILRQQGISLQDGRYDSAIVPIDSSDGRTERAWGNLILDDELNEQFAAMTRKGAYVILVSDSCHSGTLAKSISIDQRYKFIDPSTALGGMNLSSLGSGPKSRPSPGSGVNFEGRYLALNSSEDNQLSIDGFYEGKHQGLFTYALRQVLSTRSSTVSYGELHAIVRTIVNRESGGSQTPFIDERFWRSGLNTPAFTPTQFAGIVANAPGNAQLRLILKSRSGDPIVGGNMALFPIGVRALPAEITASNTLAILTTNQNGEALSAQIPLASGYYLVKALASGFNVFTGTVRLDNTGGLATILIVLDRQ